MNSPPERITPEEIAAFADGELSGERAEIVAAAALSEPAIAREIAQHRKFKAMLSAHYAPLAQAPVPDRLTELLATAAPEPADVVDLSAARQERAKAAPAKPRSRARWIWWAGPALAASLVLAVVLPKFGGHEDGYAGEQLASVLDTTLVARQAPSADTRILLSFRNEAGQYCRAFSGQDASGIGCRDANGWKLQGLGEGVDAQDADYRMAGSDIGSLLARAQDMARGPALDAEAEAAAREQGWIGRADP